MTLSKLLLNKIDGYKMNPAPDFEVFHADFKMVVEENISKVKHRSYFKPLTALLGNILLALTVVRAIYMLACGKTVFNPKTNRAKHMQDVLQAHAGLTQSHSDQPAIESNKNKTRTHSLFKDGHSAKNDEITKLEWPPKEHK